MISNRLTYRLVAIAFLVWTALTGFTAPWIGGFEHAHDLSRLQQGRILLRELNCVACHATDRGGDANSPIAPRLAGLGSGISPEYLTHYIESPHATKPGTRMPRLLGHLSETERRTKSRALVHHLLASGSKSAPESTADGSAEAGRELYLTIGCVACHGDDVSVVGDGGLGRVGDKFSPHGLTQFLEDPLRTRPSGRMPDMKLTHFEALDLASFLIGETRGFPRMQIDEQLAAEGKRAFQELGCAHCHRDAHVPAPAPSKPLADLRPNHGCLSGSTGNWPDFGLSSNQLDALRLALTTPEKMLSPEEKIALELTRLNCVACHQRAGLGGPSAERSEHFRGGDPNLGEQGRIPPALTGVGAKLKPEWLRRVLAEGASVRPYLGARMPRFGATNVSGLADLFEAADTLEAASFERIRDAKQAKEDGHRLAGSRGLNCVACHTFRLESAAPIRALDLTTMAERLQENWFHHHLRQPQRFQPLTIMPSFWPDGKAALAEVQDGDPGRQIDALWQYLSHGRNVRAPAGIVLEPLPLRVGDEAVMLRRNYPGIGKRGIGVGYPAGVNLSFDAGQIRLGSMWRGDFIEASPVWRGQGSGQVRILGRDVVNFPEGAAFAILDQPLSAWPTNTARRLPEFQFKGYTLDARRRPTFAYEFQGLSITDRFEDRTDAAGRAYFERVIRVAQPVDGLHIRVTSGMPLKALAGNHVKCGRQLVVRFPAAPMIRGQELLFDLSDRRELRLEYHW